MSIQGTFSIPKHPEFPGPVPEAEMHAVGQSLRLACAEAKTKPGKAPSWIWVSSVSAEDSNVFILYSFFFSLKSLLEFWKIFLWPSSYQKIKTKRKGGVPWISIFQRKVSVGILPIDWL